MLGTAIAFPSNTQGLLKQHTTTQPSRSMTKRRPMLSRRPHTMPNHSLTLHFAYHMDDSA
jgi:hypothetical protein